MGLAGSRLEWVGAMSQARGVAVVPCYNEERRFVGASFALLVKAGARVLFVDDGSRDGTLGALQRFQAECAAGEVEILSLPRNGGKAEAVRQGMAHALTRGAAWVGYLDADGATPAAEFLRLVHELETRPVKVVLGSRVNLLGTRIERTALRHYLGRIFATVASMSLRLSVYDTQCGAKVFRSTEAIQRAVERKFSSRWVFDVELIGRLLNGGLNARDFVEVPLQEWRDIAGSKLGLRAMLRAGYDLLKLLLRRREGFD